MNLLLIKDLIAKIEAGGQQVLFIDASSLKELSCYRRFYWNTIEGYRTPHESMPNLKIEYGTAYHRYLENWYSGQPHEVSRTAATTYYQSILEKNPYALESDYEFRTIDHLIKSIDYYAEIYPRNVDSLKADAVEQKFAFPFWQNKHYVIMLCGTIDLRGTYCGIPIITDHKTSSANASKQALIDNFFLEYEMSIQTMFYSWVHNRLMGWPADKFIDVMINGIFIKSTTKKAREADMFDGVKLARSKPISYSQEQMQNFEQWLKRQLDYIALNLDAGLDMSKDYNLAACKGAFGLCKYFHVCKQPSAIQQMLLKSSFNREKYSPLQFGGGNTVVD